LPYLNKLNPTYFKRTADGQLTFSDNFAQQINNLIVSSGGDGHLVISDWPVESTDPISLEYL
jgi:hypothetical protein